MAPPPPPAADAAPAAAGGGSGEPSPTSVFQLMLLVGRLKTTKRAGWVLSGIPAPESVSDHMYRMAMAAFALPPAVSAHAIKLALVHDLAEALVGDITPHDGVSGDEKERRERAAMATVRDEVLQGEGALGKHLVDLWEEYEAGETEAARLVKDVDKYEMIVQAYEYEGSTGTDLSPFFDSTAGKFRTPTVQAWVKPLYAARAARRAAAAGGGDAAPPPPSEAGK
ncbi:hypothetical protein BU14_0292s0004 [Porphyra umbilicalis]|uniref:5'-deoxynucleotidase n=1 Tax=Porphyra umbilicalis TaxID=2786 RepID=A0A1X6P0G3_PORUM|nr:hypothetical protein BU14_0292s0004 [Porphyra umbilicalis]|eukprot:OSX74361.1 hypothetical protein BU14_0292s0004 [Porphyra umbilicalis]